jgi:hypothetical protein
VLVEFDRDDAVREAARVAACCLTAEELREELAAGGFVPDPGVP